MLRYSKNSLRYWWPVLEGLAAAGEINVPKTRIVEVPDSLDLSAIADGEPPASLSDWHEWLRLCGIEAAALMS